MKFSVTHGSWTKRVLVLLLALGMLLSARTLALPSRVEFRMVSPAPAKLQAALIIKILAMSKEINGGGPITIQVASAPETAHELKKAIGRKIGKSRLTDVYESGVLPEQKPSAIYVGQVEDVEPFKTFCREKQVLSMTGIPELVEKGVTLGVGMFADKPVILLNIAASRAERISWHPTLLKLSKIYK